MLKLKSPGHEGREKQSCRVEDGCLANTRPVTAEQAVAVADPEDPRSLRWCTGAWTFCIPRPFEQMTSAISYLFAVSESFIHLADRNKAVG